MFRLTLKELRAKKLRLLTTALAVMLGVAFMAGTLVLTDTMNRTFDGLLPTPTRAPTRTCAASPSSTTALAAAPRLDASVVDTVAQRRRCRSRRWASVTGYAQLVDHDGKASGNPGMGAPTFGETLDHRRRAEPVRARRRHAPPAAHGEIVIDQQLGRHAATSPSARPSAC